MPKIIRNFLLVTACLFLAACPREDVSKLGGTKFGQGRLPGSAGSIRSQDYIIDKLQPHAQGLLNGSGSSSFKQQYPGGTNILAVMPGTDLANEYIIVGAHYDHLGSNCSSSSSDFICNGATDNAAGVAAALEIARAMAEDEFQGRRSIVFAFWDQEEFGLLGSQYYVNNPVVPLNQTVAYINFDILGANLLPGLLNSSLVIAAESGGSVMENALQLATNAEPLLLRKLTAPFGNRMSDHTNFLNVGVPSIFFTDAIGACYHTTADSVEKVDFDKLDIQISLATRLTRDLLNRSASPQFAGNSRVNRTDAEQLLSFVNAAASSANRFTQADQQRYEQIVQLLQNASNSSSFNLPDSMANNVLQASRDVLAALRRAGPCEAFHESS